MHDLLHTSTTLLCQRLGETLLWRFGAQFYSTPLQNVERGIVLQQPLYSREKLTDSAVYVSVTSLLQILDQCDLTDFDICFVQIGENDVKTAKDDSLGLNNHDAWAD